MPFVLCFIYLFDCFLWRDQFFIVKETSLKSSERARHAGKLSTTFTVFLSRHNTHPVKCTCLESVSRWHSRGNIVSGVIIVVTVVVIVL